MLLLLGKERNDELALAEIVGVFPLLVARFNQLAMLTGQDEGSHTNNAMLTGQDEGSHTNNAVTCMFNTNILHRFA